MIYRHSVSSLALVVALSACSSKFGSEANAGGTSSSGGTSAARTTESGGESALGGAGGSGGKVSLGGNSTVSTGGASIVETTTWSGGNTSVTGGTTSSGGTTSNGGTTNGTRTTGAAGNNGGTIGNGGTTSGASTTSMAGSTNCSGPIGTFVGDLATGINFIDTDGNPVNAHGGGIIKVGDTYYMHGERFLSTTTDNNFYGFSMYSSKDLATWKNEGIILPQQASGELGPNRKGERPHIIKCPATGEFVLYAHAASADYQTDKEVVYATSPTVNGQYSYKGPLKNASGALAVHSDMSAFVDGSNAYVIAESGRVYNLATDCHSWLTYTNYSAVNGNSGGIESPVVFKAGSTYYWIGSYKTGWRANNNFYSTAPAMTGPWTYQGYIAPVDDPTNNLSNERTWLSQSTWVQPIEGCEGTTYVYWGDHWYGNTDASIQGKYNYLATYVFQPLVFTGTSISMPTYHSSWKLDVGKGTWTP